MLFAMYKSHLARNAKNQTFTMAAFNKGGRFIHIMGTKGELRAALDAKSPITRGI